MTELNPVGPASAQSPAASAPIAKAAAQFEAVFLRQMIAAMRAPALGEDLFGSKAANQFRDLADARLADAMAGKFGIAALVEAQLGRIPE